MAEKGSANVSRRQTKRITVRVRFEVSGRDENGRRFVVRSETRNVCRDGGCLVLDRDVKSGERLKLTSIHGAQFIARVHWCLYDVHKNSRLIGFKLLDGNRGWVVHDLPAHHRSPKMSPVLSAPPDFILPGPAAAEVSASLALLRKGMGKAAKKNGNSQHPPAASLCSRMADLFRYPTPFRASRFVTLFRMD
jgi:hypothetical protein